MSIQIKIWFQDGYQFECVVYPEETLLWFIEKGGPLMSKHGYITYLSITR